MKCMCENSDTDNGPMERYDQLDQSEGVWQSPMMRCDLVDSCCLSIKYQCPYTAVNIILGGHHATKIAGKSHSSSL